MNLGGAVHVNKTRLLLVIVASTLLFLYIISKSNSNSNEKLTRTISLKRLLQVAVKAAQNGGIEVVSAAEHDLKIVSKGKTKEGVDDRVTIGDYKSHCAMIATIKTAFPTVNLISEENKTDCATSGGLNGNLETYDVDDELVQENDVTVWIDPLDATYEYTHGLHEYVTTMVCVAFKGRPIIGVIHNPFFKNTTWGWVEHGRSSTLKSIQLPSLNDAEKVTIIVSMSHSGDVKEMLQKKFNEKELVIKTAAGAGYKVLQVANGLADAYIHTTAIKKWDICAGNAILNQLGGKMTTKGGDVIDYSYDVERTENQQGLIATLRDHEYFVKTLE